MLLGVCRPWELGRNLPLETQKMRGWWFMVWRHFLQFSYGKKQAKVHICWPRDNFLIFYETIHVILEKVKNKTKIHVLFVHFLSKLLLSGTAHENWQRSVHDNVLMMNGPFTAIVAKSAKVSLKKVHTCFSIVSPQQFPDGFPLLLPKPNLLQLKALFTQKCAHTDFPPPVSLVRFLTSVLPAAKSCQTELVSRS